MTGPTVTSVAAALTPEQQAAEVAARKMIAAAVQDGNGLFNFPVVGPGNYPELVQAAREGDWEAGLLVSLADRMGAHVQRAAVGPVLCALCPADLAETGFYAACAVPMRPDPTESLVLGLCPACAGTDPQHNQRQALTAFTQFLPGLRPIIVHKGGHA